MHKTSIILAVHDGEQEEAQQCMNRLSMELGEEELELIVVDDVGKNGIAEAFYEGIGQAEGDTYLFLRPTVYLFQAVYRRMFSRLWQDDDTGAVAPVSNQVDLLYFHQYAGQPSSLDYSILKQCSLEQLSINKKEKIPALVVQDFCLMVKRDAWSQSGGFDKEFTGTSFLASADLCLRLWQNGAQVFVLKDCYVPQDKITGKREKNFDEIRRSPDYQLFWRKWKIRPEYSFYARQELLDMIPWHQEKFAILEAGCACGSTLMHLRHRYPLADLYGIELDEHAAKIASLFGQIYNIDLETLSNPEWRDKFDVIIMGDILEHIRDPWQTLANLYTILKTGGRIVISVPNIMHISIFNRLLQGIWEYESEGILDSTHLRFFTQRTITTMLEEKGFHVESLAYTQISITEEEKVLQKKLIPLLATDIKAEQLNAFQWLVTAVK